MSVRTRFAPSPTGMLHVGALRTALYAFLFAKRHGGTFTLRIEDTDRTRFVEGSEEEFIESLGWVNVTIDEGPHVGGPHSPYRQSERTHAGIYSEKIKALMELGHAYKAFDTPQELDEMREFQRINKQKEGYFGGMWRDATPEQVAAAEAEGRPFVIRQRIPRDKTIVLHDAVKGRVEFDSNTVDDPVLIKADGMPTYHFAAMVDDHLMGTTHVIRGEEWLSSAPKHICLFESFGWTAPQFVHCPVIKGQDGRKLSKRHGATRVLDYKFDGYLPDALCNFIALIGWSSGSDQELLSREELIANFDIHGIQPSPGVFDHDKLRWMNGHYIRQMSLDDLFDRVTEYVNLPGLEEFLSRPVEEGEPTQAAMLPDVLLLREWIAKDPAYAKQALSLEQERVLTLTEFGPATAFFFQENPPLDEKASAKWFSGQEHVRPMLEHFAKWASANPNPTKDDCEAEIRGYAAKLELEKMGPVVHPVRVALTGKTSGPGLFELMAVLGGKRMAARFEKAAGLVQA